MRRIIEWIGRHLLAILLPLVVIAGIVMILAVWGPERGEEQASDEIWTCSMHPQVQLPQPGSCPICGMALIPVSHLNSEQARMKQQAGIATEPVTYRELFKEIRTVGKLDYNEARVALITARIAGRVDRVYADFTGIQVKKNDHLVDIYSPDLYSAQSELLLSLDALKGASGDKRFATMNVEAARQKLLLLGILPEQIAQIEKNKEPTTHLTIYSPIGGVVIEKSIREQQYVKEGDMLYRIAEFDPIWLYLDIYEYDLGWVRYGQKVDVTVEAYPGQTFSGIVTFINPFLDDATRAVKVRVNLKNPDYKLKPAMYASATIHVPLRSDGTPMPTGIEGKYICPMHPEVVQDDPGRCPICEMNLEKVPDLFPVKALAPHPMGEQGAHSEADHAAHQKRDPDAASDGVLSIRKSAVLDTGRRQITYRKRKDGAFEMVELTLGPLAEAKDEQGRMESFYPVLAGLKAGDEVVIQGGFLLDSQRQIEGMPSLLYDEGRSAAGLHAGHGGAAPSSPAPSEHKH